MRLREKITAAQAPVAHSMRSGKLLNPHCRVHGEQRFSGEGYKVPPEMPTRLLCCPALCNQLKTLHCRCIITLLSENHSATVIQGLALPAGPKTTARLQFAFVPGVSVSLTSNDLRLCWPSLFIVSRTGLRTRAKRTTGSTVSSLERNRASRCQKKPLDHVRLRLRLALEVGLHSEWWRCHLTDLVCCVGV